MNERHGPDFPGTHSGNSQKPPPTIPVEFREEEEVFVESPPRENWRGEVPPGEGSIDLPLVTKLAHDLGEDTPVFVEHLPDHEAYVKAVAAMRSASE